MKEIALVPSRGIGDALILMGVAYHAALQGERVTIYHDQILSLASWFPLYSFSPFNLSQLSQSDYLIVQNENTERMKWIRAINHPALQILYPSYDPVKHPPLTPLDCLFRSEKSMVDNVEDFFPTNKETGCKPPHNLIHRKERRRILIHPLSALPSKNWPQKNFHLLAESLQSKGFDPLFIVSPQERALFPTAPLLSDLAQTAALIYESGALIGNDSSMGHLASLLGLPTWTIAGNHKLIALWRPGWSPNYIVTPPRFLPNLKGLRLREHHWQHFISPRRVLKEFLSQISP